MDMISTQDEDLYISIIVHYCYGRKDKYLEMTKKFSVDDKSKFRKFIARLGFSVHMADTILGEVINAHQGKV